MRVLANLGVLSSTLLPFHVVPRDEGRVWTTPQDSANGSFIFPRTYPLTLREGSSINISWSTTFKNTNLYFYQRGKVANSVQLVTNLATEWYQWEVRAEERNLTNPFVFRIVNAQGTTEEQSGGGFWSTSWYLTRNDDASQSVTLSSPTPSTTTVPSSMASPLLETSPVSVASSWTSLLGKNTEATTTPTAAAETHDKAVRKDTIIGLTVGLVVAGATIIAGLLYCLRRHKARKNVLPSVRSPVTSYHEHFHAQKDSEHHTVHEIFAQPPELQSTPPCYELPSQKYHR